MCQHFLGHFFVSKIPMSQQKVGKLLKNSPNLVTLIMAVKESECCKGNICLNNSSVHI
jgi:hypothetical protein